MKNPPRQPRTKAGELPQIRKNSRGSYYMNFHGRRYYFGRVSLVEAEKERLRIISEHEAVGTAAAVKKADVTVAILVRDFLVYAKAHYVKNGRSTGTYERYCVTVQPLLELYAATPVPEFGPKSLMTVRKQMLDSGRLCRKTINERIGYIKYIFLWGVQHELVDEDVKARLYAVEGIESGKEGTYDYDPIPPVEFEVVRKTLPHCPHPIISGMAWVQMYGGMRPQDVCNMRLCDIDRTKEVWEYAPWEHKTQHRMKKKQARLGRPEEKLIRWLGPKAQEILAPYVTAKASTPEAFLFSSADAVRLLEIEKRMNRKSKVQPSQADRSKPHPIIRPGEKYATGSYRTAIQRTVDKINRAEEKAAKKEGRERVEQFVLLGRDRHRGRVERAVDRARAHHVPLPSITPPLIVVQVWIVPRFRTTPLGPISTRSISSRLFEPMRSAPSLMTNMATIKSQVIRTVLQEFTIIVTFFEIA